MKLTRRQLTTAVCAAAIAPAQTEQPAAPAGALETAREHLKASVDALTRHELPADTEPAFRFEA